MSKIDDGGPAFPWPAVPDPEGGDYYAGHDGMSLRDWFAGQYIAGIGAVSDSQADDMQKIAQAQGVSWFDIAAIWAYKTADAMLDARKAVQP